MQNATRFSMMGIFLGVSALSLQSACDKADTYHPEVEAQAEGSALGLSPVDPFEGIDFDNACACGPSQLVDKSLEVASVHTGDLITTATLSKDPSGNLRISLAPIIDPETGQALTQIDKARVSIHTYMDATGEVCGYSSDFGVNSGSKADIAFILDTTASMGGMLSTVASSITQFAQSLSDAQLDVRYAALTMGDAFATKKEVGSAYTLGSGLGSPPEFDDVERPYLDYVTDVGTFKSFLSQVVSNYDPSFQGGMGRENYYAATVAALGKSPHDSQAAFDFFHPRSDALKYVLIFGENCGYTREKYEDGILGIFVPPSKTRMAELLGDGAAKVHSIQLGNMGCPPNLVSFEELAQASGGTYLSVGNTGQVDLNALNIADLIKNFWKVDIEGGCVANKTSFRIMTSLTVSFSPALTKTQIFTFDVNVMP